jgi:hypothetical protein
MSDGPGAVLEQGTLSSVALKLRTAIAIFAIALPEIQKSVAQWIELGSNP